MAVKQVALPEPLSMKGSARSNLETNLETLSSHVTRINEGVNEKPWEKNRVKNFLAGAKNSDLMTVLTGLGFKCGPTDEKSHQTTYQHPEVRAAAIKISFTTEAAHQAATPGLIDQVALAIVQFATNQYALWHSEQPQEKPGEVKRSQAEVMAKSVLALT